jgi:hypothetical protein
LLQQKTYPDPLASDRLEGSMNRRDRKATFILGITATTGAKPFLILGLVKKPDGSFTEAAIVPNGEEQGWGGFNHTPGETTEISFYAPDDPPALNSACREHRTQFLSSTLLSRPLTRGAGHFDPDRIFRMHQSGSRWGRQFKV